MRALFQLLLLLFFLSAGYAFEEEDDSELFHGSSEEAADYSFAPDSQNNLLGASLPTYESFSGDSSSLEARQAKKCPFPVMCSARTCCPANTKCCSAMPPLCCPTNTNCRNGGTMCCPTFAKTCGGKFCAEPGSTCCGIGICPPNTQCNTNGGVSCCRPGMKKCLGTCCPADTECSTRPGYCRRRKTTATRKTKTATATQTSTKTTADTCATGVVKRGDEHDLDIQKRQNLQPNCVYECHNGKMIPVVEIENIPGETDQLFFSMCSGILNTGKNRGGNKDFDILTYKGSKGKDQRRTAARCRDFCNKQKKAFSDPTALQCDEYPPGWSFHYSLPPSIPPIISEPQLTNPETAMAAEGGKGAHRVCIPNSQNSGAQARKFSEFVRNCDPAEDDKFVIRMKGGCNVRVKRDGEEHSTLPGADTDIDVLLPRQESESSPTSFSASSSTLHSFSNLSYVYVALEDLRNGHYSINLSLQGDVERTMVLDSDGEEYYTSSGGEASTIEFDINGLDPDYPLPAALFVDTQKAVNLSYSATATSASPSASATPSGSGPVVPTVTVSGSGRLGVGLGWGLLVSGVVMLVLGY
ncbi:hypothetical protein PHISCL_03310 [Aspergillus sclerotialis]|uniref:GPI anchored protein n=1 Tax=Aspergillus sclerotialis TaxID=2070753 RepID=A0A3A2ZMI7_9EURO|nr:hypothetical protein PHISCL_03310 [Aspergillus sclerotialis]